MPGGHVLNAQIIVSGKEDGSLSKLGSMFQAWAQDVEKLSRAAMDFLKDSTDVYRNYEDGILETRSVLQSTYESTRKLNADMEKIEKTAQHWAETTIFTTDDVANSIANAAHAGWDYNKIIEGMPSAMLIAQAGHLELADGVDYLTKMLSATGTQFSESEGFVNEWAKAADLAATDIEEVGKAFLKMGTATRLADTNEELFTFISILANSGTVGASAGTALRNVMSRLAAPTNKAEEAMEALGISEEEAEEALDGLDESATAAYKRLEEMGFTAYDQEGNLKSFMDIIQDMNIVLGDMDEKSRNDFLKTLFGTRSFQYAMTLMDAANSGDLISIYEAILGVRDTDYAEKKAETVMSGMTGHIEILQSKWEEFKRKIGEVLSTPLESGMEILGGFVDSLNDMDPVLLDALTGAISTIALAAPALMTAGTAIKIIKTLGIGSAFPWVFGAAAITGMAIAIGNLRDEVFDNHWGDLDLDTDPLNTYMNGIDNTFKTLTTDLDGFRTATNTAIENYTTLTADLSSDLLTKVITGTQLTDQDKTNIEKLGNDIYTQLTTAISNGTADNISWLDKFFGFGGTNPNDNDAYNSLVLSEWINYNALMDDANTLGASLGKAISDALDDNIVTGEEYQKIKAIFDQMNELIAIEENAAAAGQLARELHDAQTVGWDSFEDWVQERSAEHAANVAEQEADFAQHYAEQKSKYLQYIEKGLINEATGEKYKISDWWKASAGMKQQQKSVQDWYESSYAQVMDAGLEAVLNSSDIPMYDAFKYLLGSDGTYNAADFENNPVLSNGMIAFSQLSSQMMGVLGPYAKIMGIDMQLVRDNAVMFAEALQTNSDSVQSSTDVWDEYNREQALIDRSGEDARKIAEWFPRFMSNPFNLDRENNQPSEGAFSTESLIPIAMGVADYLIKNDKISNPLGSDRKETDAEAFTTTGLFDAIGKLAGAIFGGSASAEESVERGAPVNYTDNGSAQQLKSETEALFGVEETQSVRVTDNGTASSLRSSIESKFATAITQTVRVSGGISKFAEGGRATEASIFGEAGAEWAIPEQHTERTADLLVKAANASGFTWPELLKRNGGLNGGSSSAGSTTLVYSPTINGGSGDIERILRDDKERLERWWQERSMREAAASYA